MDNWTGIYSGFIFSLFLKVLPTLTDLSWLSPMGFAIPNAKGIYEIPFIDRMGFVFLFCVIGMYIISIVDHRRGITPKGLEVDPKMFKTSRSFAIGTIVILALLTVLYTVYW